MEESSRDREAKSEYSPTTWAPTAPPAAPAQAPAPIPPRQLGQGLPPGSPPHPRLRQRGERDTSMVDIWRGDAEDLISVENQRHRCGGVPQERRRLLGCVPAGGMYGAASSRGVTCKVCVDMLSYFTTPPQPFPKINKNATAHAEVAPHPTMKPPLACASLRGPVRAHRFRIYSGSI